MDSSASKKRQKSIEFSYWILNRWISLMQWWFHPKMIHQEQLNSSGDFFWTWIGDSGPKSRRKLADFGPKPRFRSKNIFRSKTHVFESERMKSSNNCLLFQERVHFLRFSIQEVQKERIDCLLTSKTSRMKHHSGFPNSHYTSLGGFIGRGSTILPSKFTPQSLMVWRRGVAPPRKKNR